MHTSCSLHVSTTAPGGSGPVSVFVTPSKISLRGPGDHTNGYRVSGLQHHDASISNQQINLVANVLYQQINNIANRQPLYDMVLDKGKPGKVMIKPKPPSSPALSYFRKRTKLLLNGFSFINFLPNVYLLSNLHLLTWFLKGAGGSTVETNLHYAASIILDVFNSYDHDKGGTLQRRELRRLLRQCGANLTSRQCNDIIDQLDTDGDGKRYVNSF